MARLTGRPSVGAYSAFLPRDGAEIERMSPAARKIYLRRQLRFIESQIGVVLDRLSYERSEAYDSPEWGSQSLGQGRWESLSSLGYLVAERDALVEAINGF